MSTPPARIPVIQPLLSSNWKDYELIDSGNGLKIERFGHYQLARPEAEAVWMPLLPEMEWKRSDAIFTASPEENGGHWQRNSNMPERWQMRYGGLQFYVQTTASRHVGVFPEQACQWDWITSQILAAKRPLRVLNLFGYTGIASLAAAQAGAQVTHVDASHKVVTWARENQVLSGLEDRPIRWIVDDVLKFTQREVRRGNNYDGIILDPPKFGRGPKGEVWEFYNLLPNLLRTCANLLSKQPAFILVTAYAVKASSLTLYYALDEILRPFQGELSVGEVCLQEKNNKRLLSMAIFARWSSLT